MENYAITSKHPDPFGNYLFCIGINLVKEKDLP